MFLRLGSIVAFSAMISLSVNASESIEKAKIELATMRQQEASAQAEFDQARQKHDKAGETVLQVYKNQFSKDPFTATLRQYEQDWQERKNATYSSDMRNLDRKIKGWQEFTGLLNKNSEKPESLWGAHLIPEVEELSKQEITALDRLEESQKRAQDAEWRLRELKAQAVSQKEQDAMIAKLEAESRQYAATKPSLEEEKADDELFVEEDLRPLEEMRRPKPVEQKSSSKKPIIIGSIIAVATVAAITTGAIFIYKRFFSSAESASGDNT